MKIKQNLHHPSPFAMKMIGGLIILFVLLLVMGLPGLEFKPGKTFPETEQSQGFFRLNTSLDLTWLSSICLSGMLLLFPAGILLLIFSAEARRLFKRYAKGLGAWLVFLLFLRFFMISTGDDQDIFNSDVDVKALREGLDMTTSISSNTELIELYLSPQANTYQVYIVGFTIFTCVGLIVYILWKRKMKQRDDFKDILRQTLKEISVGRQWDDAVIKCYIKMNSRVRTRKQLERGVSMTPGEFSLTLINEGLPEGPVNKLTTLFEKARYSNHCSHSPDVEEAVVCLKEITKALGG